MDGGEVGDDSPSPPRFRIYFPWITAAYSVFFISMARVSGPTPPEPG